MNLKKWIVVTGLGLSLLTNAYAVDDNFWIDIKNNRVGAVTTYLAQGVDPNIQSREELPAVMWAIQNEAWRVYELLTRHRAFDPNMTNAMDESPLMFLAILGETERAQALIAQGAKVNRLGWSPLHYAASKGQEPMVQMLIRQGALVNAPAPDGTTPLMMAARSGSTKVVNALLEHGADPTTLNTAKLSAADWADANKQSRLAEKLRQVASTYSQQRVQSAQQGQQTPVILIEDVIEPAVRSAEASSTELTTPSSSSSYFDLERFDRPVEP